MPAPDVEAPAAGVGIGRFVPRTFDAFRVRDFRWFYLSMFGEMGALNMQLVVRGYLAFLLTGSYAALGLIGLANALPMLVFSPLGGVLADRVPKRTLLAGAQIANLIPAGVLTALLFADRITFAWLVAGALTQGITMGLTMPARQSMLPDIVPAHRLMNAISLNMAGSNTVLLAAPAFGGFVVAWAGFEWAYACMVIAYCIAFVASLRISHRTAASVASPVGVGTGVTRQAFNDMMEGMRYVLGDQLMRSLLGLTIVASALAMAYMFLLPGYIADVFGGGGSSIGLMTSIGAAGSLCAALVLASLPDRRRGYILLLGMAFVAVGHIAFALMDAYWLAAAFMVMIGLGSAMRQASGQGLLLSYADEAYRGRVMALFMVQWSTMQIGALAVGVAAEVIGIRTAFAWLGVALLVLTALVAVVMPHVRRLN